MPRNTDSFTAPRCPRCKGEGIIAGTRKPDGSIEQCPSCKGAGILGGHQS